MASSWTPERRARQAALIRTWQPWKQANISGGHQQVNNGTQPAQQAGSVQGGGGVESLPTPEALTARYPTQRIFPPGADIQTAGRVAQAA